MMRHGVTLGVALLVVGVLLTTANFIANRVDFPIRDFFSIWLGGRLLLSGENPYSPQAWEAGHLLYGATWQANPTFLYPYPVAILFAPISALSKDQALVAWILALEVMVVASALIVLDSLGPRRLRPYALPIAAGLILFRPFLALLLNGQFSGILLLVCSMVLALWHRQRWFAGGAALALLLLKPSIGVPVIGLMVVWLIVQRRTSALLGLAVSVTLLLALTLPVRPSWPVDFLSVVAWKMPSTIHESPTLWGLSTLLAGGPGSISIGLGILAVCLVIALWSVALLRRPSETGSGLAFALTLCAALVVTPYAWPYDQVLLIIPIMFVVDLLVNSRSRFLVAATFFLIVDLVAVLLAVASMPAQNEVLSVMLPLAILAALLLVLRRVQRSPPRNSEGTSLSASTA